MTARKPAKMITVEVPEAFIEQEVRTYLTNFLSDNYGGVENERAKRANVVGKAVTRIMPIMPMILASKIKNDFENIRFDDLFTAEEWDKYVGPFMTEIELTMSDFEAEAEEVEELEEFLTANSALLKKYGYTVTKKK